jgi:nucleoside-diphosphate-sugar epimerase
VEDAADCYLFTLDNYAKMKGGVYNAGGNHMNFSKAEIAELIKKKIDYNVINSELHDKDLRHFIVNFNKIEKLGYKPKITVEEGIAELIKIYDFYEYFSHYKTI